MHTCQRSASLSFVLGKASWNNRKHGAFVKRVCKLKNLETDVVTFVGYEVRPGSWSLSQTRKDAIQNMIFPTTQKSMQSFLGAVNPDT